MTTRIDRDRQRCYDAELAAFGGTTLDEQLAWDDLVSLFEAIVGHLWWVSVGGGRPDLRQTRRDAGRSAADGMSIRIAPDGRDALTLIHELAHHLVFRLRLNDPGHGPAFRAASLRVVSLVGGPTARSMLAREWQRWRLPVGDWPLAEPPESAHLGATLDQAGSGRLRGAIALPSP